MQDSTSRAKYALGRVGQWISLITVIAVMSVGGWYLGKGAIHYTREVGVFDLRRIEVRGNNILTRAEIIEAMMLPLVGTVFDVDLAVVQERVETLNYIYGIRLGRKLPHTIYIDIIENQPLAYVAGPEGFILSREGEALPLPHGRFELELPTVSGADSTLSTLALGTVEGHEQLSRALDILNYFYLSYPNLYSELSELVFTNNGEITLYMTETSTAIRLGDRSLVERVSMLDAFLATVSRNRRLRDYLYIDLRYEHQIVVRERA